MNKMMKQMKAFLSKLEEALPSPQGWKGHAIYITADDSPVLVIQLGEAHGVKLAAFPFALDHKTFDQLCDGTNHDSLVDEAYRLAITARAQGANPVPSNIDRTKN